MTLSPLQNVALDKGVKLSSATRDEVKPGEYDVDFLVRVRGLVKVGEDTETLQVNKAKPWNLVYILLEEVNKAREAAGLVGLDLAQVVRAAEELDPDLVKKAQKDAEAEAGKIKEATRSPRKGAVTTKVKIEVVNDSAEDAA